MVKCRDGMANFILAAGRQIQESELDLEVLTAYFSAQKRVEAPALTRIQRRN